MTPSLRGTGSGLLDLAYPSKCPLCGRSGDSPCHVCVSQFEQHEPLVEFFDDGVLAFRASLFRYRGLVADTVKALKYNRRTSLVGWMATQIAAAPNAIGIEFDAVIPVPIHWTRRAHRGFNQAELLAEKLPTQPALLKRVRATPPQVSLNRQERLRNLDGAFVASEEVAGYQILLIDDVLTSGSTARECARTLLTKGAREVGILTFAGEPFN